LKKTLRGSEERFRTLVEQASDAIFVHDTDGRLLDVNQSACESLGYTRQELLRMRVTDIEQEVRSEAAQQLWRGLQPGRSQIVRGRHRRKDGTNFPVEVSLNCHENPGATGVRRPGAQHQRTQGIRGSTGTVHLVAARDD